MDRKLSQLPQISTITGQEQIPVISNGANYTITLANLQSVSNNKVLLGIDQINNTSDANKQVSIAQQAALDSKADQVTVDALSTAITAKADQTAVDLALASKANASNVVNSLATKADQVTVDALSTAITAKADQVTVGALSVIVGTKADQVDMSAAQSAIDTINTTLPTLALSSDVTAAVSGLATQASVSSLQAVVSAKADTSYVDTGLSAKADTSYVDTGLSAKADTSYVDTGLSAKADQTDLTALSNTVANLPTTGSTAGLATQAALDALQTTVAALPTTSSLNAYALSTDLAITQTAVNTINATLPTLAVSEDVNTAIALKADQTDLLALSNTVDNLPTMGSISGLALQSDLLTEVTRAVSVEATKADITYVDSSILSVSASVSTDLSDEVTARTSADALLVPKTTTVNGKALSGNVTLDAADIAGVLTTNANTFNGPQSFTEVDKGTVTTGTVTFAADTANVQKLTVGGALTLAFSGFAAAGIYSDLLIELVNGGSAAITMPAGIIWQLPSTGAAAASFSAYLTAIGRTSLQSTGTDFLYFMSTDGGVTVYGKLL
jgi:hypothetical protein